MNILFQALFSLLLAAISGQAIAPLHDTKGNLVRNERGYGFTYDFENRLTRVFRDNSPANGVHNMGEAIYAEYVVDANSNRVQASIAAAGGSLSTSYRYYDGSLVLAEYLSSSPSSPSAVYVHGPTYLDEHLLIRDGGGNEGNYLLKDLYTVAAVTDKDGAYQQAYSYTGYGLPTVVDFASVTCQPGDLDNDSVVDIADLPQFISVLLTGTGTPHELCASDLNGDGNRDGRDIQPMTNCILNAGTCPPAGGGGPSTANPFFFTGQRLEALDPTSGEGGNPATAQLFSYDFKARVFDPKHGRFQQRDPIEFADAYNLYEYAQSRATVLSDPTGEFSLPEINISAAIGNALTALNAYTAISTVYGGIKQFRAGVAVHQIITGLLIEAAIDRAGGKLFDVAFGALKGLGKFFKNIYKHCCFVEGTLVETLDGPKPIESIVADDLVLTKDQFCPHGPLTFQPVTEVFRNTASVVLWLALANGEILGTTPGHLIWTDKDGWIYASDVSIGDMLTTSDDCQATVVAIGVEQRTTNTYNLTVAGTSTFFANGVWVHNTSCDVSKIAKGHAWTKHKTDSWDKLGVKNEAELHALLTAIENSPNTAKKTLKNGREAFLDPTTGTLIIKNPKDPDGGTAFIPSVMSPLDYFNQLS